MFKEVRSEGGELYFNILEGYTPFIARMLTWLKEQIVTSL